MRLDGFLVGDAHRGLQRVEGAAFDGIARRLPVAAIADVPRLAGRPRLLERLDDVALLKLGERAAMELDQVDVIGSEALQAPLDALPQRRRPPLAAPPALAVPALGEEVVVGPARADRASDQLLTVLVAFRRVDHVEPGVERRAQQALDGPPASALVADLRAPEAEHAHVHVRLAEPPALHANLPPGGCELPYTVSEIAIVRPSAC